MQGSALKVVVFLNIVVISYVETSVTLNLSTASRLKAETEWLGYSVEGLGPSSAACVKSLAETALALDIKDCSDTRLVNID